MTCICTRSAHRGLEALARRSCKGCKCYLFFSQLEEEMLVNAWLAHLGQGLAMLPQVQSPVLGDRMYAAMASCLAAGNRKVLIIGTDVPNLVASIIEKAIAALDQHQVVFGPAEDGGYYLMGATALPPGIFHGIEWSTGSVLAANVMNAHRLGLGVAPLTTLPTLADIDTLGDLERWLGAPDSQGAGCQEVAAVAPVVGVAGGAVPGHEGRWTGMDTHPSLREAAAAALAASREWHRRQDS